MLRQSFSYSSDKPKIHYIKFQMLGFIKVRYYHLIKKIYYKTSEMYVYIKEYDYTIKSSKLS